MKSSGIIRKIDELGRLVLPSEMRNSLNINEKDKIEMVLNGDTIVLRKAESGCIFCNSKKRLMVFDNKIVCEDCARKLSEELE